MVKSIEITYAALTLDVQVLQLKHGLSVLVLRRVPHDCRFRATDRVEHDRVAMNILLSRSRGCTFATQDRISMFIVCVGMPHKMATSTLGSLLVHLARKQVSE